MLLLFIYFCFNRISTVAGSEWHLDDLTTFSIPIRSMSHQDDYTYSHGVLLLPQAFLLKTCTKGILQKEKLPYSISRTLPVETETYLRTQDPRVNRNKLWRKLIFKPFSKFHGPRWQQKCRLIKWDKALQWQSGTKHPSVLTLRQLLWEFNLLITKKM